MGRKLSALRLIILSVSIIGICWVFWGIFSKTESVLANLALKEEGNVYVFSLLGTNSVKQQISQNNSPAVMPFIQVFEEDGGLYVQPKDLKEIVNILCGNYRIHEYPEKSFEGYLTTTQLKCMNHFVRNENTTNIGEQIKINELSLSSPVSDSTLAIKWTMNFISGQSVVLDNCMKKSFRVIEKPHPGQTFASTKEFVVVRLEDIAQFYANGIKFRLDSESQLLYITRGMMN
ncbi:MAG: hypothetical protein AAGC43_08735 [Bacteroidota bacterium]